MKKMNERKRDNQWYKLRSGWLGELRGEPAAAKNSGFQGGLEGIMDNIK